MKSLKTMIIEDAVFYDAQLNEGRLNLFVESLSKFPADKVYSAMLKLRMQPGRRQMPMPADLIQMINPDALGDGRPGAEEAWAMLPKHEMDSSAWTEEMAEAFGVCRDLISSGDTIAARMAFKESYTSIVNKARSDSRPAKWTISLGHDPISREAAIADAVARKRISQEQAIGLLPHFKPKEGDSSSPRLIGDIIEKHLVKK